MGGKRVIRNYDSEGNLVSKECSKCHEIKSVSEFSKDIYKSDGLQSKCKECRKKYQQENKDKIKEYCQKRYQKNKDEIKEKQRKYRQENKESIKEYHKKHYQENKESKKERYDKKIQETLQQNKKEIESNLEKYNYIEGKEIYGVIYLVCNIKSDRYYVGQTTIGFNNRYPLGWLYKHSKKDTVKHDLELYGEDSFEYTKIFKVAHSQYELDKLEAYYINYYDSYEKGYNENRGNIFTDRGKEK